MKDITTQTINVTPTWEQAALVMIEIIRNARTPESLQAATDELLKMARLADEYAAQQK